MNGPHFFNRNASIGLTYFAFIFLFRIPPQSLTFTHIFQQKCSKKCTFDASLLFTIDSNSSLNVWCKGSLSSVSRKMPSELTGCRVTTTACKFLFRAKEYRSQPYRHNSYTKCFTRRLLSTLTIFFFRKIVREALGLGTHFH